MTIMYDGKDISTSVTTGIIAGCAGIFVGALVGKLLLSPKGDIKTYENPDGIKAVSSYACLNRSTI